MAHDPISRIAEAAVEAAHTTVGYWHCHALGDSEIEKVFYVALKAFVEIIEPHEYANVCHAGQSFPPCKATMNELLLYPQAQIGKFRVDFLILAYDFGAAKLNADGTFEYSDKLWRKLIVECDGHDFHERTKEQAAKDRSRDRLLTLDGYTVFRFTGSELWRDPIKCAEQVAAWWRK